MSAGTDLTRIRILGLVLLIANLMTGFLVQTLRGTFRALGGVGNPRGEYFWLSLVLVVASAGGALIVSLILVSCFWTHLRGGERNPFTGDDFLPAYTDLALIAALLSTAVWMVYAGFF